MSVGTGFSDVELIGVYVMSSYPTPFSVTIQSSYIHDAGYGIYAYAYSGALDLTIANNTFDKSNYGLYVYGTTTATAVSAVKYFNIISNRTGTAITISGTSNTITHSNNALFGNVTNYGGTAVEGAGYVKMDCEFDSPRGVPEPKVGSPCRAAGTSQGAPPVDYWNATRGTSIDIGAVQGL